VVTAECRDHAFVSCSPDNRTVLQQHVDFFDRDNDGIIYPSDTYVGKNLHCLHEPRSDHVTYRAHKTHRTQICIRPQLEVDLHTGFRKIGFNPLIALAAVPVIHGSLSYPTQPGLIPDIWFSINTNNIHKCVRPDRFTHIVHLPCPQLMFLHTRSAFR
jgi:peroxygenase